MTNPIFSKVRAAGLVVLVAAAAAGIQALSGLDFASFGVLGPVIGAGVATLAAFLKKELAIVATPAPPASPAGDPLALLKG